MARYRRSPRLRTRLTAAAGAVAVLAASGTVLGGGLAAASAATRPAVAAAVPSPPVAIAAFAACVTKADKLTPATPAKRAAARMVCINALRAAYPGQHGTKTFTSGGKKYTFGWQRGRVLAKPASGLFGVRSTDGTKDLWVQVAGTTLYFKGGYRTTAKILVPGTLVFVFGVIVKASGVTAGGTMAVFS